MTTFEKTMLSIFLSAVTVTALLWMGWGYKGWTCYGCGQPSAYWRLDQDGHCASCAKIEGTTNSQVHRDVRSWPGIKPILEQKK